jgi:TM2 domain-containing membrane protein YozV
MTDEFRPESDSDTTAGARGDESHGSQLAPPDPYAKLPDFSQGLQGIGREVERVPPNPPVANDAPWAPAAYPAHPNAVAGAFCRGCGKQINPSTVICPSCGVATGETSPMSQHEMQLAHQRRTAMMTMQQKSTGVAVLLSLLIPGLGQFYAGAPGKGIMFITFLLMFVIIGFFLQPINWIVSMVDANSEATKYNMRLMSHL